MNYNWNIRQWLTQYLSPLLRDESVVALIYSLVKPVEVMHADFLQKKKEITYRLLFNSQTMSLQTLLNEKFDPDAGIEIETNDDLIERLWLPADGAEVFDCLFIGADDDTENPYLIGDTAGAGAADFLVRVPSSVLAAHAAAITAEINYYRLAGKSFTLIEKA